MAYDDEQDLLNQFQKLAENQEYIPEEDASFEQPQNPLFEEALSQRDEQRRKADLLRGFKQLNQALASGTGYKADMTMANELAKRAEDPVNKYKSMVASQAAAKKEERATAKDERDALAFELDQEQKEQSMDLADSREDRATSKEKRDTGIFNLDMKEREESLKHTKLEGERLGMKINWEKIMDLPSDHVDPKTGKSNAAAVILKDHTQKRLNAEAKKLTVEPLVIDPKITLRELSLLDKIMDSGKSGLSEYKERYLKIKERQLANSEKRTEQRDTSLKLSGDRLELTKDKFDHKKTQKYQDDAKGALDSMRKTDAWKTASKTINEVDNIDRLLDDAYTNGGQSLAMIGPKVAKAIAGEVGVLTDKDVKRYTENPSLVGSLMDTIKKATSGQITETSYDNLKRLLEISKKAAHGKIETSIDTEAKLFAKREGISVEDARYFIDEKIAIKQDESTKKVELSPQDKAAKKWAEANKEDPRAIAILEKLKNKGL